MRKEILFCGSCNSFTMNKLCKICNKECINPAPARFSLNNKYSYYRLKAKGVLQ